ncbi:MAG: hypothetical protein P1U42_05055 [Phycisphaerales bacterium]|nr:hypothetical protein [Phycisphaerales bacterium]
MEPKHEQQTTNDSSPRRSRGSKQPEPNPQAEMKIHKAEEDVLDVIQSVETQLGALRKAHEEHRIAMAEIQNRKQEIENHATELEGRESELTSREVELAEMRQDFESREVNLVQRASGLEQRESKIATQAEHLEQQEAELETRGKDLETKIQELDNQLAGLSKRKAELESIENEVKEKLAREDVAKQQLEVATKEIAEAKSQLLKLNEQGTEMTAELSQARADHEQATAELTQSQEALQNATAELKTTVSKLRGREIELKERSQTLEELAEKAGSIEFDLNAAQEKYDTKVDELTDQLSREKKVAEGLRAQIEQLESQSVQAGSDSAAQVETVTSQLNEATDELKKLRSQASQLNEQNDGRVVELSDELKAAKNQVAELNAQLNDIARTADEELTHEKNRVAQVEKQIEQLKINLDEETAHSASLKAQLESKPDADPAELEALRVQIEQADTGSSETQSKLDDAIEALKSLQTQIDTRDEQLNEANEKIATLESQSAELFSTIESLNTQLETAGSDSPKVEVDQWNQSRRSRLKRMRKVLGSDAEKVRLATEALRNRYEQCEQVLTKRAELAQAYEAIAAAQRKYHSREVRSGVFLGLISLTAITLVIASISWFVAGRIAPGLYSAKVTIAAASGDSAITEAEMAQWEAYVTTLTSDPRFLEVAADRMKRRGIAEYAVPGELAKEMETSLDIASAMPGTVLMEYRGEGAERASRILDTFVVALSSAANNARSRRADSAVTMIEEPVAVGNEPLDTRRLEMGGMIFGGGMLLTLIIGGIIWKRLSAAKARFESDSRVEGLLDEAQWQMPS